MITLGKTQKAIGLQYERKLLQSMNTFSAVIFMFWYNTPILRITFSGGVNNLVVMFFVILWIVTSLLISPYWIFRLPSYLYWVTAWLFYILFLATIGYGSDIRSHLPLLMSWWFISYLGYYFLVYSEKKQLIIVFTSTLFSIFLTTATTLYGVNKYPHAAKTMINSEMDQGNYQLFVNMNIGGYDLINALLLLIPILIFILKVKKNSFSVYIFSSLFLFLIIITILKASYATTVLLMFPILIVSWYLKKNMIMIVSLNLIILMLLIAYRDQLLTLLIDFAYFTGNSTLITRFSEVSMFFYGEVADGSPKYRLLALSNSWNTFLSNPFYGVGGVYYSELNIIGAHSQWLDDLGRYGLMGALFNSMFMLFYIKHIYIKYKSTSYFGIYLLSISIIFSLGWVNPITSAPTISTMFFFIMPACVVWLEEKSKKGVIIDK